WPCHAMYLSHINITMPKGSEAAARKFYAEYLGLRELAPTESLDSPEGIWFEAGGFAFHISGGGEGAAAGGQPHFGFGGGGLDGLKARLKAAGVVIEEGPAARWRCFFAYDPFGNRIEIHQPRGLRAGARLDTRRPG